MKLLFVIDVANVTRLDEINGLSDSVSEAICTITNSNAMFKPLYVKCCPDAVFEAAEVVIMKPVIVQHHRRTQKVDHV